MSKRMQVLVDERELREMKRQAKASGQTLAEWVRQALRRAAVERSSGDADRKLAALRRALEHSFPAPDIDQMLAEIEQGYLPPR